VSDYTHAVLLRRACGLTQDVLTHQIDAYCSKECQVWAWKAGHKEECVEGKGSQLRAEMDAKYQEQIQSMQKANASRKNEKLPSNIIDWLMTPDVDDVQLHGQLHTAINAMHQLARLPAGELSHVDVIAKFESALAEARKAGDKYAQWTCNMSLEALYRMNGQIDAAIVSLEECLQLTDSPTDKAYAYKGLGECRLGALDYQSALVCFEQARCIAEEEKMERQYACLSEIGICLRILGDCERAVELHSKELASCRSDSTLPKSLGPAAKRLWRATVNADMHETSQSPHDFCALLNLGLSLAALARQKKKACAARLEPATAESAQLLLKARKMLEEAEKDAVGLLNGRLHAILAQACVTFDLGEVDEAIELLWRFLEVHTLILGRDRCACCGLKADTIKDSTSKKSHVCGGCGVARSLFALLRVG